MIGKLTGRLDEVGPSTLIVDVNGVGYEVTCAARTLASLPAVGEIVTSRHRHPSARRFDQAVRFCLRS